MKSRRLWLLDAHSSALLLHFSSADLEPHQSGKPPPRAFQFGIMEFLRTAFGLSIVQWKSLAARAASGQFRCKPIVSRAMFIVDVRSIRDNFGAGGFASQHSLGASDQFILSAVRTPLISGSTRSDRGGHHTHCRRHCISQ